jgi:small multidrug resistance pump
MFTWTLLVAAILTEVTATLALKVSDGFTKVVPSSIVVAGYFLSFFLLAQILVRGMPIGVVYAIWSAAGVALIASVDVAWFGERLSTVQVLGLFLVVFGVAALELGGKVS